jgi:hypothetical protein
MLIKKLRGEISVEALTGAGIDRLIHLTGGLLQVESHFLPVCFAEEKRLTPHTSTRM